MSRRIEACTADRFAQDVAQHTMTVLRDDGVDRHLRFKQPGDSSYWFDVLTWGGRLYIGGDCGTYVFTREHDMFGFFRNRTVNPSYWGEKCKAACKGGIEKYSEDVFKETLRRIVKSHAESADLSEEQHAALWREVEGDVFSDSDGDVRQYDRASAFESEAFPDFEFTELWDYGSQTDWDFQYLWCLHAIVWAIDQYDAHKAAQVQARAEVPA